MNIPMAMCMTVIFAAGLRTCSSHERGLRDFINEKFSSCEDGKISVVGFSGDVLPNWVGGAEQSRYAKVSNLWVMVAIDRERSQWKIDIRSGRFYFFARSGNGQEYLYNAKTDTLCLADKLAKSSGNDHDCSLGRLHVPSLVSLDEIFNRFQRCAAVYLGNGKTGIMCWRDSLSERSAEDLFCLLSWRSAVLHVFSGWQAFCEEGGHSQVNSRSIDNGEDDDDNFPYKPTDIIWRIK